MGLVSEAGIREVGDLVRIEVEDGDRLVGQGLLRAVPVVQLGGIVAVRTEDHGSRKTVRVADFSGRWNCQKLARWEIDGLAVIAGSLSIQGNCGGEAENGKHVGEVGNHWASRTAVQDNASGGWKERTRALRKQPRREALLRRQLLWSLRLLRSRDSRGGCPYVVRL